MFGTSAATLSSKLFGIICLALLLATSSGCATRVLMSSDRYEKPEPENPQWRSEIESAPVRPPEQQQSEQVYVEALKARHRDNPSVYQNSSHSLTGIDTCFVIRSMKPLFRRVHNVKQMDDIFGIGRFVLTDRLPWALS